MSHVAILALARLLVRNPLKNYSALLGILFCLAAFLIPAPGFAAPFSLKVDFRPTGSPETPGYVSDTGAPYGDRGNGYIYGWKDTTPTMSYESPSLTTDPRATGSQAALYLTQATFNTGSWEAEVPNGQYFVKLVVSRINPNNSYFGPSLVMVKGGTKAADGSDLTRNCNAYFDSGSAWVDVNIYLPVNILRNKIVIKPSFSTLKVSSIEIVERRPFQEMINFQPGVTPTGGIPIHGMGVPSGFDNIDTSRGYDVYRGYGWSSDDTSAWYYRTADNKVAGTAFDTLPYTTVVDAGNRTWKLDIPNGMYKVRVVAGDASGTNLGRYECEVNGKLWFSQDIDINTITTAAGHFIDKTDVVLVTNGVLVVKKNDRVNWEIRLVFH